MKLKNKIVLFGALFFLLTNISLFVSADCCIRLRGNANVFCQDVEPTDWQQFCDSSDHSFDDCDIPSSCQIGCCIDNSQGTCSPNSLKIKCENDGGEFNTNNECSGELIPECGMGCCVSGSTPRFTTENNCRYISQGHKMDFRDMSQEDCFGLSRSMEEGACVYESGSCGFKTERECYGQGYFHAGLLCSHPSLETNCVKQNSINCVDGKDEIYWFDSCGNRENIYEDGNPDTKNRSWNNGFVLKKNESCGANSGNINSQTCGNCERDLSSMCQQTKQGETHVQNGNFICRDLKCYYTDQWGTSQTKNNGDSWCVYDTYIGEGNLSWNSNIMTDQKYKDLLPKQRYKDLLPKNFANAPVGSEHWVMGCNEGEIIHEIAGEYRNYICEQTTTSEGPITKTSAEAVENQADECLNYDLYDSAWNKIENNIEACQKNTHCLLINFTYMKPHYEKGLNYVAEDNLLCVPRYPKGNNPDMCAEIRFVTPRNVWAPYTPEFFFWDVQRLCISVGDCGAKINYIGQGTTNLQSHMDTGVKQNINENLWELYKGFEKPVKSQYVQPNNLVSSTSGGDPINEIKTYLHALTDQKGIHAYVTECLNWNPPKEGENCERCNDDPLMPCTQYRCRSLGETCDILTNENGEQIDENPPCVKIDRNDPTPPIISIGEILEPDYVNFSTTNFQNKRIEIKKNDSSCIQETTKIDFTLETNNASQCKWSLTNPANVELDEMEGEYTDAGNYKLEHTISFVLPNVNSLNPQDVYENEITEKFGNLSMYVKCKKGANKRTNIEPYVVNFCIRSGPDIWGVYYGLTITEPENGAFIKYNLTEIPMKMWINEPAECKYDATPNKAYNEMTNSFECQTDLEDEDEILGRWLCNTTLTNLNNNENKFYIKCKDQPWLGESDLRNINQNDFIYTLHDSPSELKIDSLKLSHQQEGGVLDIIEDEGTLRGGYEPMGGLGLIVGTSGGAYDGVANCEWAQSGSSWDLMFETNSSTHAQPLSGRNKGTYEFLISCEDDAGNKAEANATYYIEIDTTPPIVTRAYKEGGNLKIITDELAKCYYTFERCNFEITNETKDMTIALSKEHETELINEKNYYIKCKDAFKNKNSECAIVIKT
ncbi:hypothetical protein AUJ10_00365 [Candidatus Pacearchaeota archaeon CG1_02_31_27]|nr:MAG: hypothetical protein AUJ10_00365 [Candidatus Pacearchaeota archaeon CG1_02_31_27]